MRNLLRRLRRDEGGWALVTAITLVSVMLGVGVATYGYVDGQTQQSRVGREKETAFNMAEAAINAQIFQLGRDWPAGGSSAPANQYPTCTQASTSPRCPSAAQLTSMFASPDIDSTTTWGTSVRDNNTNATQNHYSDATTASAPGWDNNGDGKLWVRAQARAKGKTRTIIAMVRAQEQQEDLPRGALISGRLDISNNGKKPIIDAAGGSTQSGLVAVRCIPQMNEATPCLGHALGGTGATPTMADLNALLDFQISPNITQTGYGSQPAMTPEARARMKATAIANGTYYASGCPTAAGLSGQIVYIENGNCSYTSNTQFNSPTSPGMVLIANGSLYLGGTTNFYGIIYHSNEAGSTGTVVQIQGDAVVVGGVLVDGNAMTIAGSSKLNIQLDPNAFSAVRSYGAVGVVQNTWREIKSN
jgi:Tfp pilus assembly protein PilX